MFVKVKHSYVLKSKYNLLHYNTYYNKVYIVSSPFTQIPNNPLKMFQLYRLSQRERFCYSLMFPISDPLIFELRHRIGNSTLKGPQRLQTFTLYLNLDGGVFD